MLNKKESYSLLCDTFEQVRDVFGTSREHYIILDKEIKLCYNLLDAYFLTNSIMIYCVTLEYKDLHMNAMKLYEEQFNAIIETWRQRCSI